MGEFVMARPRGERDVTEHAVRALVHQDEPVASVYFSLLKRDDQGTGVDTGTRWHAAAAQLLDEGAPPESVDAIGMAVTAAEPAPIVLAIFSGGQDPPEVLHLPDAELPDIARFGAPAMVLPLVRWLQDRPPHVVVTIDRTGADIEVLAPGRGEHRQWTVRGPDDEIERNAPGGWSQMRYQHRAEDSWLHNARRVAEVTTDTLRTSHAKALVVSGDVRAVAYLEDSLPTWVRRSVAVRHISGSRSPDGSERTHPARVAEAVRNLAEERTAALLTEFTEAHAPGGLAVEGTRPTLRALSAGAVSTLFVVPETVDDRTAWFGPAPTDVLPADADPPTQWTRRHRAPLIDVAVRAALLTGADVRVVAPDTPQAPPEGIGALCRFMWPRP